MKQHLFHVLENLDFKELFRGAAAGFAVRIVGTACGYLLTLAITRIYGVEVMGQYAFAMSVLMIVSLPAVLGFDSSLVKFVSQAVAKGRSGEARTIYRMGLLAVLPTAAAVALALWLWGCTLLGGRLSPEAVLWLAAIMTPYALYKVNAAWLQGMKKMAKQSALYNTTPQLFALLLLWPAAQAGFGGMSPLAAMGGSLLLSAVLSEWWRRQSLMEMDAPKSVDISMRGVLSQSLSMMLAGSLLFMFGWIDLFMIGLMNDKESVGLYNVALKLAMLINFTMVSVSAIAAPKFAELSQDRDNTRFAVLVRRASKLIFMSAFPVFLVLTIFSGFALSIFGPEFRAAQPVLIVLCCGQLVNICCGSVGALLRMTGHHVIFQNILIAATLLNIVLNLILIPILGELGAAIASAAGYACWNLLSVGFARRFYGFYTIYLPGLERIFGNIRPNKI